MLLKTEDSLEVNSCPSPNFDKKPLELSASSLEEELCEEGYKLHIDPRFADTHPWSLKVPLERNNPLFSLIHNTSITITDYNDLEQRPLNEECIASVTEEDEIPYIDDIYPEDLDIYIPETSLTATMNKDIEDIKTFSNRRRKTVSFDLVAQDSRDKEIFSMDQPNTYHERKSIINEELEKPSCETTLRETKESEKLSLSKEDCSTNNLTPTTNLSTTNRLTRSPPLIVIEVPVDSFEEPTAPSRTEDEEYTPFRQRKTQVNNLITIQKTDDTRENCSISTESSEMLKELKKRICTSLHLKKDEIESDLKNNELLGMNLLPSKSAPILHHQNKKKLNFHMNPRIAQSLSNNNEQGFYQNLSAYRIQNQNHPGFGERPLEDPGSHHTGPYPKPLQQLKFSNSQQVLTTNQNNIMNRPASTYYQGGATNYIENKTNPPKMHLINSGDNLGKSANSLNIDLSGNSISQQNKQQSQPFLNIANRSKSIQNFNREGQFQNTLRMNQILAPSMPNIADNRAATLMPHVYNSGMQSSQSMQNVASINQVPNHIDVQQQQQCLPNNVEQQQQQQQQQMPKNFVADKMDRHNRTDSMQDMTNHALSHSNNQQQDKFSSNGPAVPQKLHGNKYMSSFSIASSKQQLSPNIPPAPQNNQKQLPNTEETPPLPPTTTHPLFKTNSQSLQSVNCVANSADPQRGSYYPPNTPFTHQANFVAANPWEREEREKEQEIRQEQIKIWRDKQITNLSNLTHRYPQQEEQLKTLVLEREFQRRAHETEEQEEDSEPYFEKENDEDLNSIQASNSNFSQKDVDINQNKGSLENRDVNNKIKSAHSHGPFLQNSSSTVMQPKGILKNNRYDSSNFSVTSSSTLPPKTNRSIITEERHSYGGENESKNISNMNSDIYPNKVENPSSGEHVPQPPSSLPVCTISPPSPPERNISYLVMSQKQQSSNYLNSYKHNMLNSQVESHNQQNNNVFMKNTPPQNLTDQMSALNLNINNSLLILGRDTKRVSFHDEENNYVTSETSTPTNEQDYNSELLDMHSFSSVSAASNDIMQSPMTPQSDLSNSKVKTTPGVIGAQEVYRDPRQRRLAEKHEKEQQRSNEAVPEKLSFKEKMKIFALESGEDQTPKDKLKISRAQRDIDAAH